jgi:hypothetical protein
LDVYPSRNVGLRAPRMRVMRHNLTVYGDRLRLVGAFLE